MIFKEFKNTRRYFKDMFHAYGWQVSYTTWVKIGDTTVKIWVSDIGIDRKNAFTRTQQNLMDKIHKLALT